MGAWRRGGSTVGAAMRTDALRSGALARAAGLLALALAVGCAAAAAPALAATTHVDGISDQNLGLWTGDYLDGSGIFDQPFSTSFFPGAWVGPAASQHLLYARFVTAPDAVAQGGACEQNLDNWFAYVTQTLHLQPVIAVWDVAEGGCADHGAPSTPAYTTDIQQLLGHLDSLYPGTAVPDIEAWNEPNSSGVPAAAAAAYWTAANGVCASAGCTAIAGDFVDNDPDQGSQPFNPGCAANLTFNNLATYERAYVTALGTTVPTDWGLHPYFAVNCEQPASVTTFEAGLPELPPPSLPGVPPHVWFTEVGAWECIDRSPVVVRGATQQQADAAYLVDDLMSPGAPGAPLHVFYYGMAAPGYTLDCAKYTDSELYEANTDPGPLEARPAAATIYGPDSSLAATAGAPSAVSATAATFNGTVTPGGIYEASYSFRYGQSTAYGSQTPPVALGSGLTPQAVSATVAGLQPGAAYHYQLLVIDSAGLTVDGPDVLMAPVVVSATPASVTAGHAITVAWSGLSDPSSTDWVGLYSPGAPDGAFTGFFYAGSCSQTRGAAAPASGSCTYTMPATPGIYELRLYNGPTSGLLTASAQITSVPPPPVLIAAPAISGASGDASAYPGDTLACSTGSWSNTPTAFAYAWAGDGSALPGATGATYVPSPSELGQSLSCSVTASNAGGSGPAAASAAVSVVSPQPRSLAPPSIADSAVVSPSIAGGAVVGVRLTESHARWSNLPTSFAYQWERCNAAGGQCRPIAEATGRSYTPTAADVGSTIRVLETASNARASGVPASSAPSAVVKPQPPNTLLSAATIDQAGAAATFRFRGGGHWTRFECSLARKPARLGAKTPSPRYAACRSPVSFTRLPAGAYVFRVRAVGPGGADATPASRPFTIS